MILVIGGCGYIGSALYQHLTDKFWDEVVSVDAEWYGRTNDKNVALYYDVLTKEWLSDFHTIILCAAHSSVKMCDGNAKWAMKNNVINLVDLIDKMADDTKLIYMSSSSVYNGGLDVDEDDLDFKPTNVYDITKYTGDVLAEKFDKNVFGLRLGTVNGYSKNLRSDLMINKMYLDAKDDGYITVTNKDFFRPVLDIQDLCKGIERLINWHGRPGIYNLASFNMKIGEIASLVGEELDVPVVDAGESPTYDFSISHCKFTQEFEFDFRGNVRSIVKSLKSIDSKTIVGGRFDKIQKG